jgi:outer membrane lipoprotein-sorting protein
MKLTYVACAFFVYSAAVTASPTDSAPTLKEVLGGMDHAAAQFHSMSAKITRVKHTAVLNSDDPESGTVYMKKNGAHLQALLDITEPDKKTSVVEGREVQVYYPNMKQVNIYDAGKNGEQLEQFLSLGFGTSGSDLEKTYTMRVVGTETVNGEKTAHLELIPKSPEATKLVKKIDLWIGERNYPVQEKIYEPSGDYDLWTYSDVQINGNVRDQDLKLKLPNGVKRVYPQKS